MADRPGAAYTRDAFLAALKGAPGVGRPAVVIERDDGALVNLRVSAVRWGASMQRLRGVHRIDVPGPERPDPDVPDPRHAGLARHKLAAFLAIQAERQALADALGLETHEEVARSESLDPARILVDRATAILLTQFQIDPARLVAEHRRLADDDPESRSSEHRDPILGVRCTTLSTDRGATVPTLACTLPIGGNGVSATLHAGRLALDARIPDTLLAGAVGGPLGRLVSTRIPELDARTIVAAACDGYTAIQIAPDPISIADARAATPLFEDPSRPQAPR